MMLSKDSQLRGIHVFNIYISISHAEELSCCGGYKSHLMKGAVCHLSIKLYHNPQELILDPSSGYKLDKRR